MEDGEPRTNSLQSARPRRGGSASDPVPPGQSQTANDRECTDHDPHAAACHETLGHDLRVDSLKHPDGTHQGEDNTDDDSCNSHLRIVDPQGDRRAHIDTRVLVR